MAALVASVVTVVVARTVVTPPRQRAERIAILSVDGAGGLITLGRTVESLLPGDYGLFFAGGLGHARVGEILSVTDRAVTRRLVTVDRGQISGVDRCRLSGWYFDGPQELGVPFEEVQVLGELGYCPAWLFPSPVPTARWVIQVHGRAVTRAETLRAVSVFRGAGYTSLLVSYRNDGDAPSSPDGRYGLGDTEWHDVDSAISFARDHGAEEIVLMGWSMGGATVLQALTRSQNAALVTGVVLDSPVIDWVSALVFQGRLLRLPALVRVGAIRLIAHPLAGRLTGQSRPIDFTRLDFVTRAGELDVPILLLHSDDDGYIPIDASRALATARRDIVRFEEFTVAAHTKLWNYDRKRWNDAVEHWLKNSQPRGGQLDTDQRA